ncbi:hypothetical protein BVRB_6g147110 [Beta vulgaris subsp. vulgaris]|nr:hypothetical protein BVRB_6g147110 [Beta vulgaris subsp. vulgaris]
MALLPRFISLGFQGKYLECVVGGGDSNGLIQLSGEDVLSPKARIEVEKALSSDELVHLKCCYTNKYLRRGSESDDSIAAVATEQEEDQSKWSCTLFRPRPRPRSPPLETESDSLPPISSDTYAFDFEIMAPPPHDHPNGGGPYYLFSPVLQGKKESEDALVEASDQYHLKMSSNTSEAAFTVTDTQAVVQLPRFVIFKADNGRYLRRVQEGDHFTFAVIEEDYLDAAVFEVFRMTDGSVRLRLCFALSENIFLGLNGSNIMLEFSGANPYELRGRFRPVKLGSDTNDIGLRVLSNNCWCKRHATTGNLVATSNQVEATAVLQFEEAVGTRSVYEINYRMQDAKLYDFAPVTSVTKDVKNASQTTQAGELTFTYTETKSETWGNMNSWGVGVSVSMKARIPFVGGLEVSTGAEYEGEYQWGEANETEQEIATELKVEVPPMSRTQVTMIVSRGTLEVPFSYTQRDTLYNGQLIVTEVDGGIFSGVNTYVSYETTEKSL